MSYKMGVRKPLTSSLWPPASLRNASYRHPVLRPLTSLWFLVGTITAIVVVVALGTGLGVGLHKRNASHSYLMQNPAAYSSSADGSLKVDNIPAPSRLDNNATPLSSSWNLTVDDTETGYKQIITGFGATVTDATVASLGTQTNATQQSILEQLVTAKGANFSLMRHTIGSSDLSASPYTYDDNNGKADPNLSNFSLGPQGTAMAQLLAQMQELNNNLLVIGSSWSPPGWMKINRALDGNFINNSLDDGFGSKEGLGSTGYSHVFGDYFVKYIQAYAALGVSVSAISIQNEPLNNQSGYPTMYVEPDEAGRLINEYVGPALQKANLNTTVWGLDDNTDDMSYAQTVIGHADAYVDAVAWHCYATTLDWTVLTDFHNQHPNISQYMTECWTPTSLDWTHTVNFTMGPLQNWANGITAWTLGTDDNAGPHLGSGGCDSCIGIVSVNSTGVGAENGGGNNNSEDTEYSFNVSYYMMTQFSKFIPQGSRILQADGSSTDDNGNGIQTVASLNPDGSRTVVIENTFNKAMNVTVEFVSGDVWTGGVPASSVTSWILP